MSPNRKPLAVHFGNNLRACRHRAGLSQEELGFRASLHRSEVGLLERARREPRLNTIIKLADALEISRGELLGGMKWTSEDGFVFGDWGHGPVEQ